MKKPDKQLDLPTPPPSTTTRILPMELRLGDRHDDETGEMRVKDDTMTGVPEGGLPTTLRRSR